MAANLDVSVVRLSGPQDITLRINKVIIAGWTGRDRSALQERIRELDLLGIKTPAVTPVYCEVAPSRLTTADAIEVLGVDSTGEVEVIVVDHGGELLVGLGSDHTDRRLEAHALALSKQICDKPIAPTMWPLNEVRQHWDQLILRSWILDGSHPVLYQEGPLSQLLDPVALVSDYEKRFADLKAGYAMFCGTFPAIGGVRPCDILAIEVEDPVLTRKITRRYSIKTLRTQS
jgi:hypothetical protein